ncbi:MAG: hypothetical protein BWK80_60335 [Desulfobacteraceae bacterium IS3]|nr:MAG: hypothetical protein BWK80_60335 [Desulfobacteraceae bacterium IS3]
MKILMFFQGRIQHLPPLITAAACMADCGAKVRVLAFGSTEASANYLRSHGVELVLLRNKHPETFLGKVILRIEGVLRLIWETQKLSPDCIWYHQSHFLFWYHLLPFIHKNALMIAHSHELDSHIWIRWLFQKALVRRADMVITPEPNRAWILQQFSGSTAPFVVIPNRSSDDMIPVADGTPCTEKVFREHGGATECSRFLIYQGGFMPSRCLKETVLGFKQLLFKDVGLILMGGEPDSQIFKELAEISSDDSRIVLLPYIPPPKHLLVTKGCIGGILLYEPASLNSVYCAPNKIYEYATMGLGMILPEFPGISSLNKEFGLGVVCNPTNPDSIAQAMREMLSETSEKYQNAAKRFLESTSDPEKSYQDIYPKLDKMIRNKKG